MAPEWYSENYDISWDICSLGIVALELLTRKPLYTNKEAQGNPHKLRELWNTKQEYKIKWSYEAKQFLEYTLQYDPHNRLKADELLKLDFIGKGFTIILFPFQKVC